MKINEKTLDISLILGGLIAVLFSLAAGFTANCEEMQDKAFRLHILANSDSSADQSVKLDVRDYIIEELGFIFSNSDSKEQTVQVAKRNLNLISERVNNYLKENNCGYSARCAVEKSRFGTRKYGNYTLPAGEYDSLKIILGEGKGKNWWCVLFPSVCIPAAAEIESPFPERTLYKNEKKRASLTADSLNADIEYKFLAYEWLRSFFGL